MSRAADEQRDSLLAHVSISISGFRGFGVVAPVEREGPGGRRAPASGATGRVTVKPLQDLRALALKQPA